jgi:hypothetical protein
MSTNCAPLASFPRRFNLFLFLGLAAFLAIVGCSTPETRSREKATSFEALKAEDQRLVLQGKIREGLNEDAVYVALGRPSRITRGQKEGKKEFSWIYSRLVTRTIPAYRPRVVRFRDGRSVIYDDYAPYYDSYLVDAFEVFFREGKVTGWKEL